MLRHTPSVKINNHLHRNRALSIRRKKDSSNDEPAPKHRFTMASLRGMQQPDLSKKLYKLIKSENHAIQAYETAGRERLAIASQLSEWGDETGDDAISEVSDKLGVLLAEMAEQEDSFAQGLEEYRGVLKQIRNTESSVQPSRDQKSKISDELQKLKYKEPASVKIPQLEQELVRAEAQSLVAEAQLTNITRQKFREAYYVHLAAVLERCEKQALLAKRAQQLLALIDDTPIVPGEAHEPFAKIEDGRRILNDAEADLRAWVPSWERRVHSATGTDGMAKVAHPHAEEHVSAPDSAVGIGHSGEKHSFEMQEGGDLLGSVAGDVHRGEKELGPDAETTAESARQVSHA